jgi:fumarate reductase subunit D
MRRSNEPLFWSLFSGGGMLAALLAPALILVTGFLVPAKAVSVLFGVAALIFFHWAHRFRHVLIDVGLRRFSLALAVVCYLTALGGTAWAGVVAFT